MGKRTPNICITCGDELTELNWTEGKRRGYVKKCSPCHKIRMKQYYLDNKEKINAQGRQWRQDNPIRAKEISNKSYHDHKENKRGKLLWKNAKARALKKNLPFDLTIEDVVIPEICPIFLKPFDNGRYAASIDRIIPEKGYVKDNIRIISRLANSMKWDATPEELDQFCEGIDRVKGGALVIER